jgi:hypothetical protein
MVINQRENMITNFYNKRMIQMVFYLYKEEIEVFNYTFRVQ